MSSTQKFDYYQTLELTRKASQQQIKQAYKRLALIHHPDKNQGSQHSKFKFRQISQAYTVLNDPQKRDNYDKYGVADIQGIDFEQFMGSFGAFDQFLNQILSFNTFDAMFSGMDKKRIKRTNKARGRAKGRSKNPSTKQMNDLANLMMMGGMGDLGDLADDMGMQNSIEMAMLKAMMGGGMMDLGDMDKMQKQLQKMILQSDDDEDEQDEQDLTQQQMQIFEFGNKNVQKKKVGKKKKKTQIKCKLDGLIIQQQQILLHFSQKHMQQFKKWKQTNLAQKKTNNSNGDKNKNKVQEQQIQY